MVHLTHGVCIKKSKLFFWKYDNIKNTKRPLLGGILDNKMFYFLNVIIFTVTFKFVFVKKYMRKNKSINRKSRNVFVST